MSKPIGYKLNEEQQAIFQVLMDMWNDFDGIITGFDPYIQKIEGLIKEAMIAELELHATEWVEIQEDGQINPAVVHDRITQLKGDTR